MSQRSNTVGDGQSRSGFAHSFLGTNLSVQYDELDALAKSKIDKMYMEFLGTCGCIVSRKKPIQRHHVRMFDNSGIGCKPPDIYCVPLYYQYHTGDNGIHTLGQETFCKKYGIDLQEELRKLHKKFEDYYRRKTNEAT